jgi:proline iminopeptidase
LPLPPRFHVDPPAFTQSDSEVSELAPHLLFVPTERLAGTAGDARIHWTAGKEPRKGIVQCGCCLWFGRGWPLSGDGALPGRDARRWGRAVLALGAVRQSWRQAGGRAARRSGVGVLPMDAPAVRPGRLSRGALRSARGRTELAARQRAERGSVRDTTAHLVADIEWLREHLGVERWLIHGMSWGSSLGLAYAEAHPQRVSEVVLAAVTMTRRCDVDWFARGVGRFFPAQWQAFRDGVPAADRDGDLVSVYARLLASPDPTVREQAARNWCDWEEAIVSLATGGTPNPRYADPRFRMGFARLVTHYFSHAAWLEDDQLLREADRLAGIPSVLIHGRLDLGSPLRAAWRLARAWPGSELVILDTSGHTSTDLREHVVAAIERFARTPNE